MNKQIAIGAFFIPVSIACLFQAPIYESFFISLIYFLIGFFFLSSGLRKKGYIDRNLAMYLYYRFSRKPAPPVNNVSVPSRSFPSSLSDSGFHAETFDVAGVSYYLNNLSHLGKEKSDWRHSIQKLIEDGKAGRKVFRYAFSCHPVKLVPEPDNPNDRNAVRVVCSGEHIGYIPSESNVHVLDILNHRNIISISGFIGGGQYRIVNLDGTNFVGESGYFATITIQYS